MKKSMVMFALAMAFAQGVSAAEMQFCVVTSDGHVRNCASTLSSCQFLLANKGESCVAMPKKN